MPSPLGLAFGAMAAVIVGSFLAALTKFGAGFEVIALFLILSVVLLAIGMRARALVWVGFFMLMATVGYAVSAFAYNA